MEKQDKKSLVLRLSPTLHKELIKWAEDDFRSLNGQIEYVLTEAVRKRTKKNISDSVSTDIQEK